MIVSFLILLGFQDTVKNKLYSFSGHMQITRYTLSNSIDELPVSNENRFYLGYDSLDGIRHVQQYAYKAGLIRTDEEILGVVLKGIDTDFDKEQFMPNLLEGEFVHVDTSRSYAKEVMISKVIANKLKLNVGDDIIVHFFQNPPRARKLNVVGIYETNLSEYFDEKMIIKKTQNVNVVNSSPGRGKIAKKFC